ncbi:MAG: hypothetical protein A2X86_17080 [Bdellovibrionales bacterium GWA2_49_15]|nr:MAG: hypothetical protein A2X86_17080 [Bdellovibrionales bacterium GWA2_49_15]HAZ14048.1 hypothetical protein [Bdellovibrionales bacterium]
MERALVTVKNLTKVYATTKALAGVNFDFMAGTQYAIQGASGSGKSTLLYLLGGLDRPSSGSICADGKDLADFSNQELAVYRNLFIGFVFQFHFLLPSMNCRSNILLPALIGNVLTPDVEQSVLKLAEYLEVQHCLEKMPYQLSGGEQQRINLIRALSLRPKLLLCDEPTGNLDSINSEKVTLLLKTLATQYGATLIVVTHDAKVASHFEQNLWMKDGHLFTRG